MLLLMSVLPFTVFEKQGSFKAGNDCNPLQVESNLPNKMFLSYVRVGIVQSFEEAL